MSALREQHASIIEAKHAHIEELQREKLASQGEVVELKSRIAAIDGF